jgi:hypothetical protein
LDRNASSIPGPFSIVFFKEEEEEEEQQSKNYELAGKNMSLDFWPVQPDLKTNRIFVCLFL